MSSPPILERKDMLLEVHELKVSYEGAEALRGVCLGVLGDAITTLVGSNGAGKTTLLRTISGLKRVTAGNICFEGQRIDDLRPPQITKLGIAHVMEGRRLFPFMSVLGNLKLGAYLRTDKKAVNKSLEEVFQLFPVLRDRVRQSAGTLSGGEQQMVSIARALMSNPKLLLLDEPSMGLSPLLVHEVARTISELKQRGVSILLVEQNALMALEIADKGYVLETGKIALGGTGKELLENEEVKKVYLGG